jgi:hypothetical protein
MYTLMAPTVASYFGPKTASFFKDLHECAKHDTPEGNAAMREMSRLASAIHAYLRSLEPKEADPVPKRE